MNVILTAYDGAILGPIARLLGYILQGIYFVLSQVGIENVGICIILFTFFVNALMIPLQLRQQKFTKMSSIMNPEIQVIQEKYKNKKDQESQRKMQMEMQAVYQKYGVSPAGGCLPLIISMVILFALYRVIYNIPAYVPKVYAIYEGIAQSLQDLNVSVETLADFLSTKTYVVNNAVKNAADLSASESFSYYIDVLGQFNTTAWNSLSDAYPALSTEIAEVSANASHINSFLGLNIADTPKMALTPSILIPIASAATQIISTRLSMAGNPQQDTAGNPTASSMKTMNMIMPVITGFMCFAFPIGVGIYWISGNVFRIFQSIGINIYFNRIDMDDEMQKNVEKSRQRLERRGIDPDQALKDLQKKQPNTAKKKDEKKTSNAAQVTKNVQKSNYKRANHTNYKEGSIAAYANMLNRDTSSQKEEEKKE